MSKRDKINNIIKIIYMKEKKIFKYNIILLTPFKILIPNNIKYLNFFYFFLKKYKIKYKLYKFNIYIFSIPLLINIKNIEIVFNLILSLNNKKKISKKLFFYFIKKKIKKYI
ncbi:MAG: hypothetical protein NHF92_00750 [Candidatus Shikimatogenerans bostrichidophilus]|nr:MAG: hypothetical protein NHF92_00750 [Candidatus Shikimatogenerans bostrichidophilus]